MVKKKNNGSSVNMKKMALVDPAVLDKLMRANSTKFKTHSREKKTATTATKKRKKKIGASPSQKCHVVNAAENTSSRGQGLRRLGPKKRTYTVSGPEHVPADITDREGPCKTD